MSDQDPTEPIDPTRVERPAGGSPPPPADDPTSVLHQPAATRATRETTTTTTTEPRQVPPTGGGVSTGVAIAAALAIGLLGLLVGYLLWGTDDDDTAAVDDTVPTDAAPDEDLQAERDMLAQQAEDQQARIAELESSLEDVTAERDQLQAELDEGSGDEVTTVPAPDVTDGSVDDAQSAADENGWTLVEREVPADGEEPGTVVAQYPEPDTPMIEGSVLVVDVAAEDDGG